MYRCIIYIIYIYVWGWGAQYRYPGPYLELPYEPVSPIPFTKFGISLNNGKAAGNPITNPARPIFWAYIVG